MNTNKAHIQYQTNSIKTATPQELTFMLYNGLVRFIKMSIQGIEEKNVENSNNYNIRAQDILSEFMLTLDYKYEVSSNLLALYDYMRRRLIEANIKKDIDIMKEVLGFAEELRDTWAQAMKIAKQQQNQIAQQQKTMLAQQEK